MFVNRTLKGCCYSKLLNSVSPLKSINISFTRLSRHISISIQHNRPMRSHQSPFLQLSVLRTFTVTSRTKNVPLELDNLNKPKTLDDDDPRLWYLPKSSTNQVEKPAYTYLRNHPDYQKLFFQPENYSSLMTADGNLTSEGEKQVNPAVKALIDLCNTQPNELITDPQYEPVFTQLVDQSPQLTDFELLLVFFNFRRFSKLPKGNVKDYRKIWHPLDHQCFLRIQQQEWNSNLEYWFHLVDLITSVGLSPKSRFHWELGKRLYRRVDSLSKEEFIRMMVCWGGINSLPASMSVYNIEFNLPKFIDQLSSEEVAVLSMGFNRTQTCVHNMNSLQKMLQIVAKDAQQIPSSSLSSVCNVIMLSTKANAIGEDIYNFLDTFVSQIRRLNIHACAALMSVGLKRRVKHEGLCKQVLKKMEGKVEFIRSRDLEYICDSLASLNIECDQLFAEIVQDFRRKIGSMSIEEFSNAHGRSFVRILVNLCMRNIYPEDLISVALSEEFLKHTFGKSMYTYTQEVAYLDISAGIEAVTYNGPRISEKYRGFLTKKNMLWVERDERKAAFSAYQKTASSLLEICVDSLGGPEFCHLCNIVPPFRTIGVVYCLRESDNKPMPLPENFTAIEDFEIKYLPEPDKDRTLENNVKFHAFVLIPPSQITNNTREPTGMAVMHCRQMKKMGFHVHPIYLGLTITNPTDLKKYIPEVLGLIPEEPKIE